MAAPITATFRRPSGLRLVLRQLIPISRSQTQNQRIRCMSTIPKDTESSGLGEQDPFPVYATDEVQTLLRRMTGFDVMKLAGPKKTSLERPTYRLLTDSELDQEQASSKERLSKYLDTPPPYMNPRKPVTEPLAVDPELEHFDESRYVFSDVSFGVKDRKRSVVVREVDGTLRVAPWDLKERMNQLYNPREGRSIIKPQMFEEQHMERLLSQEKFVYILERACAQFEPDDPDFLRTCHRVYSTINSTGQFEVLRSTCFFAPLAFHLIWTKEIDRLLCDMLTRDLSSDAADLITLYSLVHHQGACATLIKDSQDNSVDSLVNAFVKTEAKIPTNIELAFQSMQDKKRMETDRKQSSLSSL